MSHDLFFANSEFPTESSDFVFEKFPKWLYELKALSIHHSLR